MTTKLQNLRGKILKAFLREKWSKISIYPTSEQKLLEENAAMKNLRKAFSQITFFTIFKLSILRKEEYISDAQVFKYFSYYSYILMKVLEKVCFTKLREEGKNTRTRNLTLEKINQNSEDNNEKWLAGLKRYRPILEKKDKGLQKRWHKEKKYMPERWSNVFFLNWEEFCNPLSMLRKNL